MQACWRPTGTPVCWRGGVAWVILSSAATASALYELLLHCVQTVPKENNPDVAASGQLS
jgi:hypothetical protein